MTPTQLRADIYHILDEVLATGMPVEIERHGKILRIVRAEPPPGDRLGALVRRDGVVRGDPEELVHLDWTSEWRP
ncbi:MAG: type II toxin-antitoxin system Phd/YefM family antitoxin [Candidatus Schekmanbacteria bacterium]|nr:type II toxin-antitoxin system Phd/YefM family antitoxin [Candidatus Schekmanbacteria bacterium]